ncbi:MAG: hypothetical protein AAFO81_15375 [Pseudomonadota bacterium]
MDWEPISESEIHDLIDIACERMNAEQRRVWEKIKIAPEKWIQDPWGHEGKGFWIVAIIGRYIVWYNDIEDGFNLSTYVSFGKIDEYWCNQDQLEWTVQNIINGLRASSE